MQATVRCLAGAALFGAVVFGLTYGSAKQNEQEQIERIRQLAQDECLANDPSVILHEQPVTQADAIRHWQRLKTLHDICTFGMGGKVS